VASLLVAGLIVAGLAAWGLSPAAVATAAPSNIGLVSSKPSDFQTAAPYVILL
jgi:hypothetical protein